MYSPGKILLDERKLILLSKSWKQTKEPVLLVTKFAGLFRSQENISVNKNYAGGDGYWLNFQPVG